MIKDLFLRNAVKLSTVLDKIKKDKRGVDGTVVAVVLVAIGVAFGIAIYLVGMPAIKNSVTAVFDKVSNWIQNG
jgi:hypothetical protein